MSTDIASLGIKVDTTEVASSTDKLKEMAAAGKLAERATDALTLANTRQTASLIAAREATKGMTFGQIRQNSSIGTGDKNTILAEMQNEMAAARELSATKALASAAAIAAAKAEQDAMAKAAEAGAKAASKAAAEAEKLAASTAKKVEGRISRLIEAAATGGSVSAASLRSVIPAAVAASLACAPLLVVIAAIAAAAVLLAAGFGLAFLKIKKDTGDVAATMGLTAKQIEELKKKGVDTGVTIGDAFKGLTKTLADTFAPQIDWLKKKFGEMFDYVVTGSVKAVRGLVGNFSGAVAAIKVAWQLLPAAFSDIIISAANNVIKTVEDMVNKVIAKLNPLTKAAGMGEIANVKLDQINNPNAGAAANAKAKIGQAGKAGYKQGVDAVNQFGSDFAKNTVDAAKDRIGGELKAPGKATKSAAENAYDAAVKKSQAYIEQLKQEDAELGKNQFQIARMRMEREKALAPTDALKKAIEENYNVWEKDAQRIEFISMLMGNLTDDMKKLSDEFNANNVASAAAAEAMANHFSIVSEGIRGATDEFASLFGSFGSGVADMVDALGSYTQANLESDAAIKAARADRTLTTEQLAQREIDINQQKTNAEMNSYGQLLRGTKNLFSQKSAAYKALNAIEQVYSGIRLAMALKEIIVTNVLTTTKVAGSAAATAADGAHTVASVFNSGLRATADGVAAIAKAIASLPFPFNLIAGAATAAALVAVGVKIFGGGGGGGASASAAAAPTGPTDYTRQDSPYSVLTPGGGPSGGTGAVGGSSPAGGGAGGVTVVHNTSLVVQGNGDAGELRQVLDNHQADTIQKTRQAVQADLVAASRRQQIGNPS